MKILEKRPLALILCIMLGGFSFFADFSWVIKLTVAAVSLLLIGIIFIFENLKFGRKAIVVLSLAAFAISLLLSIAWSWAFYPTRYYGQRVNVEGKITSIDTSGSSTATLICKTEKIDGKRDSHTLIMYIDKQDATKLGKYDMVAFDAEIRELPSGDDGFDGKTYYIAKGYSALCNGVSDMTVIGNEVDRISDLLVNLRLGISNKLKLRTDFDTGAFLAALIVGDRTDLSGNTKLNFARLGISHILALSGMHLAILTVALNFLLMKMGVKKKLRVSLLSLTVLFYMGLTGFSASVLRSGLMLIISGALYLLATKADSVTSLVISVAVIVAVDPVSVYDTSLWLSAFATLGVIVFAEMSEKPDKDSSKLNKALLALKNACLVSVFAFCATFALIALRYDSFSVVSILTTIVFSFVIQFLIYGGLLLLLLGGVIPFGRLLIFFSDAILWLAERISSMRWIYVSMNFALTRLLIVLLTVFFFAFLVLNIKSRKRGVAIITLLLVSVFVTAEIHTALRRYDDDVVYAPSKHGDIVLMKSDADVSAVYSGKAFKDGAWDVLEYFASESITYIDNLILASYSYTTVDFIDALAGGIKIENVMLPIPSTDDEIAQAEGLSYLLSGYGSRLEFYEMTEYLELGKNRYRLMEKVDYYYGEYPSNVFEIVTERSRYTYVSACKYDELSASARALIWNSENLLIGTVGNSNYYIFDMRLGDVGRIYYLDDGRLTDEAQKYYEEKGALIHCIKSPTSLND